jgi:hypothetical protein
MNEPLRIPVFFRDEMIARVESFEKKVVRSVTKSTV